MRPLDIFLRLTFWDFLLEFVLKGMKIGEVGLGFTHFLCCFTFIIIKRMYSDLIFLVAIYVVNNLGTGEPRYMIVVLSRFFFFLKINFNFVLSKLYILYEVVCEILFPSFDLLFGFL